MPTAQQIIDLKAQLYRLTPSGTFANTYIKLLTDILNQTAETEAVLTTKGDLASFSTVIARLAVGTNGQVLTADSAQALGVKWAASPALVNTTKGDLSGYNTAAARVPVGANDTLLAADSTDALGVAYKKLLAIPGGSELKVVAADVDYNNTDVLADVTGLETSSLPVGKYLVEALLILEAASTDPDIDIKFIGSVNTTLDWEIGAMNDGTAARNTIDTEETIPLGAVVSMLHIKGYLNVVDTPGTLKIQAAQNSATEEDTSVKAGSILKVTKIA